MRGLPKLGEKSSEVADGAVGAVSYVAGQGFNFGFQLLLLSGLGSVIYGRIGLAHLMLITLIFIGDLGYSLYFLREKPKGEEWRRKWRLAYGHRIFLMFMLASILLIFWAWRYGMDDLGFMYLIAAMPSAFFSLFNFSSPLIAAGRRKVGFLAQQIVWPTTAVLFLPLFLWGNLTAQHLTLAAGLSISAGYLFQATVNLSLLRFNGMLLPLIGKDGLPLLAISARLALLGVIGTLHDRLTPFLMEQLSPDHLPAYLILLQALSGASGVMSQIYRLLVARESVSGDALLSARMMLSLLQALVALFLLGISGLCPNGCDVLPPGWVKLSLVVLLTWLILTTGSTLASVLIGRSKEANLTRALLVGVGTSTSLQLVALTFSSVDGLLWGRLLGAAVAMIWAFRLLDLTPPWTLAAITIAVFLMTGDFSFGHEVGLLFLCGVVIREAVNLHYFAGLSTKCKEKTHAL